MTALEKFNEDFKVGDAVEYLNEKKETVRAFLRWPAEKLNDTHREVIWVTGRHDAVDFKDVDKNIVKLIN
jgi:Icc-related predicted phosphoesterase